MAITGGESTQMDETVQGMMRRAMEQGRQTGVFSATRDQLTKMQKGELITLIDVECGNVKLTYEKDFFSKQKISWLAEQTSDRPIKLTIRYEEPLDMAAFDMF